MLENGVSASARLVTLASSMPAWLAPVKSLASVVSDKILSRRAVSSLSSRNMAREGGVGSLLSRLAVHVHADAASRSDAPEMCPTREHFSVPSRRDSVESGYFTSGGLNQGPVGMMRV